MTLSFTIVTAGLYLFVCFRGGFPLARHLQLHAGAAGFGQAYRDRLFGGTCSMPALSHMVHLFSHKFSCLRAGRPSFTGIFVRVRWFSFQACGPLLTKGNFPLGRGKSNELCSRVLGLLYGQN